MIDVMKNLWILVLLSSFTVYYPTITVAQSSVGSTISKEISKKKTSTQTDIASNKSNKKSLKSSAVVSGLFSNAFNFKGSISNQVDPRTGILSAYVKVGSMISNDGRGPNVSLMARYNSASSLNLDGLGKGWSWNLSHYEASMHTLMTSGGNAYLLEQQSDGTWKLKYHKLHDIIISGNPTIGFTITYKSGLKERLSPQGYEEELIQQDGRHVSFHYDSNNHLTGIYDDTGRSILLSNDTGFLDVKSQNTLGLPIHYQLNIESGELRSVIFPGTDLEENHHFHLVNLFARHHDLAEDEKSTLHYTYNDLRPNLVNKITYPTGAEYDYLYDFQAGGEPEMKIKMQNGSVSSLPVVVKATIQPGFGEPNLRTTYQYGSSNADEHNYTGFNSGLTFAQYHDVLFDAPVSYQYTTKVNNGRATVIRTYNKYHLVVLESVVTDVPAQHIVSKLTSYYCSTDGTNCSKTRYSDLSPNYSLPIKITQEKFTYRSEKSAVDTTLSHYDNEGNLLSSTDTYGRTQTYQYCPVAGSESDGCPVAPPGWPFINLVYHANYSGLIDIKNTYQKQENYDDTSAYHLVLASHSVGNQNEQIVKTAYQYNTDKEDVADYGLIKDSTSTLEKQDNSNAFKQVTNHVSYVRNKLGTELTNEGSIDVSLPTSSSKKLLSTTRSTFTGQVVKVVSPDGKFINKKLYDNWGRIITATSALGTPYEATTAYHYVTSPAENELVVTAANGYKKRVTYDGLGRVMNVYTSSKTESDPSLLRESYQYDAYGDILSKTSYTEDSLSNKTVGLTTHYDYDAVGRVVAVTHPTGEVSHVTYDDSNRCTIKYTSSKDGLLHTPISLAHTYAALHTVVDTVLPNDANIPTACNLLNEDKADLSTTYHYDNLWRMIAMTDPLGRQTKKTYDDEGHLASVTDPKGDQINYVYDMLGNVVAKYLHPASGGSYLVAASLYNEAGQLRWKQNVAGQKAQYDYNENGLVNRTTNMNGDLIETSYNVIGKPTDLKVNGQPVIDAIDYYPKSGLVNHIQDKTGSYHYGYDLNGNLTTVAHEGNTDYPDYDLEFTYDRFGRQLSMTNTKGNVMSDQYDENGLLKYSYFQKNASATKEKVASYIYGVFNRLNSVNYGSGMQRKLSYDNPYGRVSEVRDTLDDKALYQWSYSYDKLGNILTKTRENTNQDHTTERYQYDELNNLSHYECVSDHGSNICPRDVDYPKSTLKQAPIINEQAYQFTPLNTLESVTENLTSSDGKALVKVLNYYYTNKQAPLRLDHYTEKWADDQGKDLVPAFNSQVFVYDKNGNILTDGLGNSMTYNAFNEITGLVHHDAENNHKYSYVYNGMGRLINTMSSDEGARKGDYLYYTPGGNLVNEGLVLADGTTHRITYLGKIARAVDDVSVYYENSYKGDIINVLKKQDDSSFAVNESRVYSPYGMEYKLFENKSQPEYEATSLGFDGERTDANSQWQFLGNGHRAYNPMLKMFMTEDPYTGDYNFGSNNPVMNIDPSGNIPKWLMATLTLGGSLAHGKTWKIVAQIPALLGTAGIVGYVTGSLAIAEAVKPSKGLAIANITVGSVAAVASIVAAAATGVGEVQAAESISQVVSAVANTTAYIASQSAAVGTGIAAAAVKGQASQTLSAISAGFNDASIIATAGFGIAGGLGSRGGAVDDVEPTSNVVRSCFTGDTLVAVDSNTDSKHRTEVPIKDIKLGQQVLVATKAQLLDDSKRPTYKKNQMRVELSYTVSGDGGKDKKRTIMLTKSKQYLKEHFMNRIGNIIEFKLPKCTGEMCYVRAKVMSITSTN